MKKWEAVEDGLEEFTGMVWVKTTKIFSDNTATSPFSDTVPSSAVMTWLIGL